MSGSNQKELLNKAITFALSGLWDASHKIVQDLHSSQAFWIHAVLHKIEGDEFNSRYWYERAQQSYEAYNDPKQELIFIQNNIEEAFIMDNHDAIEVTCTDNGKKVIGYILNYKIKDQLDISLNTVKIRMQYRLGIFVGSMAGMEFVVQEDALPKQFREFQR
jgi:hypothetical protein